MSHESMPFLDLFLRLQKKLRLAPEQYNLLREALNRGFGWGTPADLKRLCRLLWVKPSPDDALEVFDRVFKEYWEQELHRSRPLELPTLSESSKTPPPNYPQFAPPKIRSASAVQPEQPGQAPIAIKTAPAPSVQPRARHSQFILAPTHLPLTLTDIRRLTNQWRRWMPDANRLEFDLRGTIARIEREGKHSDLVFRPVMRRRSDLLVLIDDSNAMLPFCPVIQPLMIAVERSYISHTRLYRFTNYPGDYLYHQYRNDQAEPVTHVLSQLYPARTLVVIISDAGAASKTYSDDRAARIEAFLFKLSPCVKQVVWINPLPETDWRQTTATVVEEILTSIGAIMVPWERKTLQQIHRQG